MGDPSYSNGVHPGSIVPMIRGIVKVMKNDADKVPAPVPIHGIPPSMHVPFFGQSIHQPSEDIGAKLSRRLYSHSLSMGTVPSPSIVVSEAHAQHCDTQDHISRQIAELIGHDRSISPLSIGPPVQYEQES